MVRHLLIFFENSTVVETYPIFVPVAMCVGVCTLLSIARRLARPDRQITRITQSELFLSPRKELPEVTTMDPKWRRVSEEIILSLLKLL